MMTYEMIGVADQNGRTYESKFGTYNKSDGFSLKYPYSDYSVTELLYDITHENVWSLKEEPKPKKMTKEEIEKALGYKIELDNGNTIETIDTDEQTRRSERTYNDLLWRELFAPWLMEINN